MNLTEQILELSRNNELSGIPIIDAMILDAKGITRMILPCEVAELNKGLE